MSEDFIGHDLSILSLLNSMQDDTTWLQEVIEREEAGIRRRVS